MPQQLVQDMLLQRVSLVAFDHFFTLVIGETYSLFGKKPTKVVRTRSRLMPVTARVTLQKKELNTKPVVHPCTAFEL